MTELRKIGFLLETDEMGYPPAENEWLWASAAEGTAIELVIALLEEGKTQGTWGWETGLISEVHSSA